MGFALLGVAVAFSAVLEALSVASIFPLLGVLSVPDAQRYQPSLSLVRDWIGSLADSDFRVLVGGLSIGFMAVSFGLAFLTRLAVLRFVYRRYHSLSMRVFGTLLREDLLFHLQNNSSKLLDTVISDCDGVVSKVLLGLMLAFSNAVLAVAILAAAMLIHPVAALAAFGVMAGLYLLVYRVVRKRVESTGRRHSEASRQGMAHIAQVLAAIREVKVFGAEVRVMDQFRNLSLAKTEAATQSLCLAELPRKVIESVAILAALMVMVVAARHNGEGPKVFPLAAFFAFAAYRLLPCLQQVYHHLVKLRFYEPAVDRLAERLARPGLPDELVSEKNPGMQSAEIEFRKVSFRYPDAVDDALRQVSLLVPRGTSVAFVGSTGSGKSTAAGILIGLLEPTAGHVCLNGQPIDGSLGRDWQETIGYVPQQVVLLDDTVARNIAFGAEPDLSRVVMAAKAAHLHEFIETRLFNGYDTVIGEFGARLSGGERQRLGVARALYRDPSLLVLDEATSAVDPVTEQALLKALLSHDHRRTVVMITHRLSTLGRFDSIVYFERGAVLDFGSLAELSHRCAGFRALTQAASQGEPA